MCFDYPKRKIQGSSLFFFEFVVVPLVVSLIVRGVVNEPFFIFKVAFFFGLYFQIIDV